MAASEQVWGSNNTSRRQVRAAIFAEEATEAHPPLDMSSEGASRSSACHWLSEIQAPMRSLIVVVLTVLTKHRLEVSLVHD